MGVQSLEYNKVDVSIEKVDLVWEYYWSTGRAGWNGHLVLKRGNNVLEENVGICQKKGKEIGRGWEGKTRDWKRKL